MVSFRGIYYDLNVLKSYFFTADDIKRKKVYKLMTCARVFESFKEKYDTKHALILCTSLGMHKVERLSKESQKKVIDLLEAEESKGLLKKVADTKLPLEWSEMIKSTLIKENNFDRILTTYTIGIEQFT